MTSFNARRTPAHKGPAAWSAILPGQPAPVPLPGDLSVDVAIIGGGFAGLAAARRLRDLDPDLKIAVLEASRLAEGASGRNSGFMIDLPHELTSDDYAGHGDDRAMIDLNRQAIAFARAAADEHGIDRHFLDPAGKVLGRPQFKIIQTKEAKITCTPSLGMQFDGEIISSNSGVFGARALPQCLDLIVDEFSPLGK